MRKLIIVMSIFIALILINVIFIVPLQRENKRLLSENDSLKSVQIDQIIELNRLTLVIRKNNKELNYTNYKNMYP